jgi:toxin-antitoxin system PIN domain toxin
LILVDVNILIYAASPCFAQYERARTWLDDRLNGVESVALPWPSILGFIRITTNARIFPQPAPIAEAWRQAEEWLDCPPAWIPAPTARHREVLGLLLVGRSATGNLVQDAHLAALAIEHGLTLCSTDSDFARFPELRWQNPLRSA